MLLKKQTNINREMSINIKKIKKQKRKLNKKILKNYIYLLLYFIYVYINNWLLGVSQNINFKNISQLLVGKK